MWLKYWALEGSEVSVAVLFSVNLAESSKPRVSLLSNREVWLISVYIILEWSAGRPAMERGAQKQAAKL